MTTILPFDLPGRKRGENTRDGMWAVVALIGRTRKVANIYPTREAALTDCAWRRDQVRAYAHFLEQSPDPAPTYHIAPIHRAELPKGWKPMPALGVLHGRFA
ncbi:MULTISPECIES: hypothetical protein [Acetobacter]|uniref:Uncharacterized protein n=1 Tax=Acetobacter sacchari TaxID=2661687 RepID=A0ABS3LYH5_9PROT|nr:MULTISPECIES: hypothetical protein [Acetobacter]MBO1360938.1 hypothetical protein [Acetobacter sacchari]